MLNALKLHGKMYAKSCSSEIAKGHEKDSAKIVPHTNKKTICRLWKCKCGHFVAIFL